MPSRYPETLPQLLDDLMRLYKLEGHTIKNADKLRDCIEFLMRLLHK